MIIQLIKIKHVQLQTKTIYNCHIQKKQEALDRVLKMIFRVTVGVTTRLEKGGRGVMLQHGKPDTGA